MNLKNISDEKLQSETKNAVSRERRATTLVLHHLHEVEYRRLYAKMGFSSLFEYCIKELGYNESSAYRRIDAMRALRDFPELEGKIESGKLSLSVISQAQRVFRKDKTEFESKLEILRYLENKSSREAERFLASISPESAHNERIRAISDTHSEVKFVVNQECLEDIEKLRNLLSHHNLSLAETIHKAVKVALAKFDPVKQKVSPTEKSSKQSQTPEKAEKSVSTQQPTRYVSQELRNWVFQSDGGQCSFVDPESGKRCVSRYKLQIDHRIPFFQGGESSKENLRLLCAEHNRYEARRLLGEWTEKYRDGRQKR